MDTLTGMFHRKLILASILWVCLRTCFKLSRQSVLYLHSCNIIADAQTASLWYTPEFGVIVESSVTCTDHATQVHVIYYVFDGCLFVHLANHILQARAVGGDAISATSGF
jgi:hypothetical protein